jgi:hypothetical protein
MSALNLWNPGTLLRFERSLGTSTNVAIVTMQNGRAFVKALGNPEGPHALASDWVGTHLARLFGLPTLNCAIIEIDATKDEIRFKNNTLAQSGTAFCTQEEPGHTWAGGNAQLEALVNLKDIARLVVFDTWIRNRDRHPPKGTERQLNYNNVFLSKRSLPEGQYRLLAIDHTHAFADNNTLSVRMARIENIKDRNIYGRFPEFVSYCQWQDIQSCLADLQAVRTAEIEAVLHSLPQDWEVMNETKNAWIDLILQRAAYLGTTTQDFWES